MDQWIYIVLIIIFIIIIIIELYIYHKKYIQNEDKLQNIYEIENKIDLIKNRNKRYILDDRMIHDIVVKYDNL